MSGFFLFLVFVGGSTTCQSTPTPSELLTTPLFTFPSLLYFTSFFSLHLYCPRPSWRFFLLRCYIFSGLIDSVWSEEQSHALGWPGPGLWDWASRRGWGQVTKAFPLQHPFAGHPPVTWSVPQTHAGHSSPDLLETAGPASPVRSPAASWAGGLAPCLRHRPDSVAAPVLWSCLPSQGAEVRPLPWPAAPGFLSSAAFLAPLRPQSPTAQCPALTQKSVLP